MDRAGRSCRQSVQRPGEERTRGCLRLSETSSSRRGQYRKKGPTGRREGHGSVLLEPCREALSSLLFLAEPARYSGPHGLSSPGKVRYPQCPSYAWPFHRRDRSEEIGFSRCRHPFRPQEGSLKTQFWESPSQLPVHGWDDYLFGEGETGRCAAFQPS